METDVIVNDHLDKANLLPPQDPDGEQTMVADLVMTKDHILDILTNAMLAVQEWLCQEKDIYNSNCKTEAKKLQDESVEELDENLRKQWPRKGRLEVEVYQERKG